MKKVVEKEWFPGKIWEKIPFGGVWLHLTFRAKNFVFLLSMFDCHYFLQDLKLPTIFGQANARIDGKSMLFHPSPGKTIQILHKWKRKTFGHTLVEKYFTPNQTCLRKNEKTVGLAWKRNDLWKWSQICLRDFHFSKNATIDSHCCLMNLKCAIAFVLQVLPRFLRKTAIRNTRYLLTESKHQ